MRHRESAVRRSVKRTFSLAIPVASGHFATSTSFERARNFAYYKADFDLCHF
jgi:hypothetical protein